MKLDSIEDVKEFLVTNIEEQLDITYTQWNYLKEHKAGASQFSRGLLGGQAVAFEKVLYFISQIDNLKEESK